MQYGIEGRPLPVVTCTLTRGEAMITQSGGMSWMSNGIEMSTNMKGGLGKALGRAFTGESMFMTTYTCNVDSGYIAFTSSFPGDILAFELNGTNDIVVQKCGFLASESTVQLAVHFQKKLGAGLFGGEGFLMQRLSGVGKVFVEIDGHCVRKDLQPGEVIKVDSGHIAAMTSNIQMEVEMVKGLTNMFFGGEGLFNTVLRGPGTVWLQTMPAMNVAKAIIPYIPSKS